MFLYRLQQLRIIWAHIKYVYSIHYCLCTTLIPAWLKAGHTLKMGRTESVSFAITANPKCTTQWLGRLCVYQKVLLSIFGSGRASRRKWLYISSMKNIMRKTPQSLGKDITSTAHTVCTMWSIHSPACTLPKHHLRLIKRRWNNAKSHPSCSCKFWVETCTKKAHNTKLSTTRNNGIFGASLADDWPL